MKTAKITESEISSSKISLLPNRPTAPKTAGGGGFTPTAITARFDALPLLAIERINSLLDDISASPEESISAHMQTGISDGHTLGEFFSDLQNGNASAYIYGSDKPLSQELEEIKAAIRSLGGEI